jgi:hypothetical protein
MANPWKNFTPLPPSRQRRDDSILEKIYTVVGITTVGAVVFALLGGFFCLVGVHDVYEDSWNEESDQFEMTQQNCFHVVRNGALTGGAIGAVLGGVGALGAVVASARRRKKPGETEESESPPESQTEPGQRPDRSPPLTDYRKD